MTSASLARKLAPKIALSLVIGGLVASIAARNGLPLVPPSASFRSLRPWAVPAYAILLLGTHWFRAVRWRHLIAPIMRLPLGEVIALNWIGFFAIFALPFRLGEAARPAITKLRHGVPVSAGVGTIAVERIVDGLLTSLCVAIALFVVPMRATEDPVARHLPAYGSTALVLFGGAFTALFLFLWQRERTASLVRSVVGLASPKLADLVASKIGSMADGVRSIGDLRLAIPFLVETLLYWGLNAFSMWILAIGCGLPISFTHAVAIMGILAIGILLPAGPGLFGSFQLSVSAGLSCYVAAATIPREGALYVFLLYGIQALVICLCGLVPLYRLNLRVTDVLE